MGNLAVGRSGSGQVNHEAIDPLHDSRTCRGGPGAIAVFALVAMTVAYSEFRSELHGSRLPAHFQRKMVTMQLAPLVSGAAVGAAVSLLTRYRRAWLWGLLAMLPLTLFMIKFCLQYIVVNDHH